MNYIVRSTDGLLPTTIHTRWPASCQLQWLVISLQFAAKSSGRQTVNRRFAALIVGSGLLSCEMSKNPSEGPRFIHEISYCSLSRFGGSQTTDFGLKPQVAAKLDPHADSPTFVDLVADPTEGT